MQLFTRKYKSGPWTGHDLGGIHDDTDDDGNDDYGDDDGHDAGGDDDDGDDLYIIGAVCLSVTFLLYFPVCV